MIGPQRDTSSGRDLRCGPQISTEAHKLSLYPAAARETSVVAAQPVGFGRTTESSDDCRTDSLDSGHRLDGRHLSGAADRQNAADGAAARAGAGEVH